MYIYKLSEEWEADGANTLYLLVYNRTMRFFRNMCSMACSMITLLSLVCCSEPQTTETKTQLEPNEQSSRSNSVTATNSSPDWSNPALSPYGGSIGNIVRGYFLVGDFERLRQHIIYPTCYSPDEIDYLLRTSEWGYDIELSNLKWNADSTEFVITYKTRINQTSGMDQYMGALVNDSAKLYFFPNTKTRFRYTGKDEFDELCGLKNALSNVLFEVNTADILPESKGSLERIVEFFKLHNGEKAVITGHTSAEGSIAYNQELSEKRAKALYDHLKVSGINVAQISYMGKGASEPIYPNNTEENRIKNRRVVIEFY